MILISFENEVNKSIDYFHNSKCNNNKKNKLINLLWKS